MTKLCEMDKIFMLNLLTLKKRKNHAGYIIIQRVSEIFFEHRIIMQLYLNRILSDEEIVHHIDRNKSNNKIRNLRVMDKREHLSMHHAGSKKPTSNQNPHNKLSKEKVKEIRKLSKEILKTNGKPNCLKIGKMLDISGFTVARYI